MKPHHHRAFILGAEALLHYFRPQPPRRPKLRDFLEEVVVHVEEERQPARERVELQPRFERGIDVRDPVGKGEREFLRRGRASLADVVAGDRYRVPVRNFLRRKAENVSDDPHRAARRIDVRAARDVFLQHVVLDGAVDLVPADPAALRHDQVQRQQDRRGRVDRHRGRNLVERQPGEQRLHVRQRAYRHADASDFALGQQMIRVAAHLRGQVERDRQPRLTLLEQVAVAAVRLLRAAEARVLAHRPQPSAIHRRLHAAGKRILAWKAEVVDKIEVVQVFGIVRPLDFDSRAGDEIRLALSAALQRRIELALLPLSSGVRDFAIVFRHRNLPLAVEFGGLAYSMTISSWPFSTAWPATTLTSTTLPALGALTSFSIFIASTTMMPCSALTSSPRATSRLTTRPGIADFISTRPLSWRRGPAARAVRRAASASVSRVDRRREATTVSSPSRATSKSNERLSTITEKDPGPSLRKSASKRFSPKRIANE